MTPFWYTHSSICAPLNAGITGKRQAAKRLLVGSFEIQSSDRGKVKSLHRNFGSFGPGERVGDRHPHVRIPKVSKRRTVSQVD